MAIIDELDDISEDEAAELRSELLEQLSGHNDIVRALGDSLQEEAVPLARILDALGVMLQMPREEKIEFAGEASVRERLKRISNALK